METPLSMPPPVNALTASPEGEQCITARERDLVAEPSKGRDGGWVNRFMAGYRMDSDKARPLPGLAEEV